MVDLLSPAVVYATFVDRYKQYGTPIKSEMPGSKWLRRSNQTERGQKAIVIVMNERRNLRSLTENSQNEIFNMWFSHFTNELCNVILKNKLVILI